MFCAPTVAPADVRRRRGPAAMSEPTAPPALADALVAVARLRLALPRGEPAEVRAFYPDDVEGLWSVPLFDGDRGRVVVLATERGDVAAHAGLHRASARLRALFPSAAPDWLADELAAVLDAVGGLTPGLPRYPDPTASDRPRGAIRLVIDEPARWVRFAATGAHGPPPAEAVVAGGNGGATPPQPIGQMVCDVAPDRSIVWRYELEGVELGRFAGIAAADEPDQVPPLLAEQLLAAARVEVASPLAVAAAPVRPAAHDGVVGDGWQVDLLGFDPVSLGPPQGR